MILVLTQRLHHELIHFSRKDQCLVALLLQRLHDRQLRSRFGVLRRNIVDVLLVLRHRRHEFLQCDELSAICRIEQQQVLQLVTVSPKGRVDAELDVQPEVLPELLVLLPVLRQHRTQFIEHLALDPVFDQTQLVVVLQHLTRNVQGQILRIHEPLHKPKIRRQQLLAVVHDEHTPGVQLQTRFVVLGIESVRHATRDVQQRREIHVAFHIEENRLHGIREVKEVLFVERRQLFLRDLRLRAFPQRHHGIQGLFLRHGLGLAIHFLRGLHRHADGVADVVGILLHQILHTVALQVLRVVLLVVICFQVQHQHGAPFFLVTGLDLIAIGSLGLPFPGLFAARRAGIDRDFIGHHERRVEADTELANDIRLVLVLFLQLFLECQGAALGDRAQVFLQFFLRHADAVVADGQRAVRFIEFDPDPEVSGFLVVLQRPVIVLVNGIRSIGDQLPQEDLLVCVNGIDHQIQQPPALRLKFFFLSHDCHLHDVSQYTPVFGIFKC